MSDNKNVFTLADAAKIVYLNGENAKFYKNSDFLGAELTLPDTQYGGCGASLRGFPRSRLQPRA